LNFLKSRTLVDLVTALPQYDSAGAAINALVPEAERPRYQRALAGLAASGVIVVG
jgi:putative mycofactocin binding protein MftB